MIFLVVYLLNVIDLVITNYFINVLQAGIELNFIMLPLLDSWAIWFIKYGVMGAFFYLLYRNRDAWAVRKGIKAMLVIYVLVIANNSFWLAWYFFR